MEQNMNKEYATDTVHLFTDEQRKSIAGWLQDYFKYDENEVIPIGCLVEHIILLKIKKYYMVFYGWDKCDGIFDHRYCKFISGFKDDPYKMIADIPINDAVELASSFLKANIYIENHDYFLLEHLKELCKALLDLYDKEHTKEITVNEKL